MREKFYVEVAPGYVRLRHQLGLRTKFGRRRLGYLELQVVRQLEALEEAGVEIDWEHPDPEELAAIIAEEERERRQIEFEYVSTIDEGALHDMKQARCGHTSSAGSPRPGTGTGTGLLERLSPSG